MPYIGNPIYQSAFVTDQFSGNGSTTAFTMSVAPAGVTNVLVAVSGVLQDPSTYGVSGNTLTFSAAPPSGTGNISCRYLGVPATGVVTTAYRTVTEFTATAGQTTFTPPSYTVGYINVYRNGVRLGSADYTASNGTTVVLTTGATAGDLVTTESFLVSSVLNALPQSGGTLSGNLVVTGTETINGNLGVGTSPGTDLITAYAAGTAYIAAKRSAQSIAEVGFSLYGGTSGINWAFYQPSNSNDYRIWNNNVSTDVLKIDQAGNWYMPVASKSIYNSSGRPMLNQTGGVLQTVYANSATQTTTASSSYTNSTLSASITPSSTSSKILVILGCSIGQNGSTYANLQLWRNGSNQFTFATSIAYTASGSANYTSYPLTYLDSPASTSAQTYAVYFNNATASGTVRFNSDSSFSSITLMEIAQ